MPIASHIFVKEQKKCSCEASEEKKVPAFISTSNFILYKIEAETQYRYVCQQCGILIGYTSISYDEFENLQEITKKKNKESELQDVKLSNRHYLYILSDALVLDPKDCQVIKAVSTHASEIK